MEFCPNCRKEISSTSDFCPHCGKKVVKKKRTERYVTDNFNRVVKQPIVLVPGFLISFLEYLPGILIVWVYGQNKVSQFIELALARESLLHNSDIFISIVTFGVLMLFLQILFAPFLTELYIQLFNSDPINIRSALTLFLDKLPNYIFSELYVAVVSIILLSPVALLYQYDTSANLTDVQSGLLGFIFVAYLIVWSFVLYSLMFALPVMVVENIGIQEAVRVALRFNRQYFFQILGARFLVGLIPSFLGEFPLSGLVDSIADVFVSIVILDLYMNYRRLDENQRNIIEIM